MFVADAGMAIWVVGLLLVGFLGFFLVAVTMVFRFIGWIFRGLTGANAANKPENVPRGRDRDQQVCPHPGCGHTNVATAFFCGRCGRRLRRTYDVDAYG